MPIFKTCNNGHNYDSEKFASCPYCPGGAATSDYEKNMMDFRKTQLMDEANPNQFDKTVINEENADLRTTQPGGPSAGHPFSRTTIVAPGESATGSPIPQTEKRKIVGWLVTFSHDEYGQDYKLYVGKNKIGTDPRNDVVVQDSSVSGEHATILFRENEFLIKDNFSTNGTKINGVTSDEGKLKDGDTLTLGNTDFKFKTVF